MLPRSLFKIDVLSMFPAIKSSLSLFRLIMCLLALAPSLCWAEGMKVVVLLSDNSAPYQSFANALSKSLPALMRVAVLDHPQQFHPDASRSDLIVAVGVNAAELAATQTGTPVLAAMVPKMSFENLLAKAPSGKPPRTISAIYLDQPWDRQLDFLQAALPTHHRIGFLFSADAHIDIVSLRNDVAKRGGLLKSQIVRSPDSLFANLENVLDNSDVLFAIPDINIYNSSSIRNILLTSYRQGVPLIGLSRSYVNAGALCAIFSTPEQLAEQASSVVVSFERNRQLPESQYPSDFTISVNLQVAQSLGIKLPSPEAIRRKMDKNMRAGQ